MKTIALILLLSTGLITNTGNANTHVRFKGNDFELAATTDTQLVQEPTTGKWETVISKKESTPLKMNGVKIYTMPYMHQPKLKTKEESLGDYIEKNMKQDLDKLIQAGYNFKLNKVVIDENGKIVYYEYSGLYKVAVFNNNISFDDDQIAALNKKLRLLLDKVQFEPAYNGTRKVPYLIQRVMELLIV